MGCTDEKATVSWDFYASRIQGAHLYTSKILKFLFRQDLNLNPRKKSLKCESFSLTKVKQKGHVCVMGGKKAYKTAKQWLKLLLPFLLAFCFFSLIQILGSFCYQEWHFLFYWESKMRKKIPFSKTKEYQQSQPFIIFNIYTRGKLIYFQNQELTRPLGTCSRKDNRKTLYPHSHTLRYDTPILPFPPSSDARTSQLQLIFSHTPPTT